MALGDGQLGWMDFFTLQYGWFAALAWSLQFHKPFHEQGMTAGEIMHFDIK